MLKLKKIIESFNMYVLIGIAVVGMLLMYTNYFGLVDITVAFPQVDLLGFYSAERFFEGVNTVMIAGEKTPYLLLHLSDYIMIFGMDILLSLLLTKLLKHNNWVFIVPLFTMLFDYTENILFDLHLLIYPTQINFLGSLAGVFTILKFTSMVVMVVLAIVYKVREKKEHE